MTRDNLPIPGDRLDTSPAGMAMRIATAHNVTALAKLALEAFELTVTLERDVKLIDSHYDRLKQVDRELHREVMEAMRQNFAERERAIGIVEKMAEKLVDNGDYECANQIVIKLMELLSRTSPVDEAVKIRDRR